MSENVGPSGMSGRPVLSLETKVKGIEERLHRLSVTEETKFQTLCDHLLRTEELLANERLADELIDERLQKDLDLLSTGAAADANSVRQQRKEAESRLERQATQRATALIEEFRKENIDAETGGQRAGTHNCFDRLGEEVPTLRHQAEQLKGTRKSAGSKLDQAISDELEKIAGAVDVEKRIRVQQQNALIHTMENFASRIETEISDLKYSRHSSAEHLLNLLEEACARTEARVHLKTGRPPLSQ